MSDRSVTVEFKYETASSGTRDPIAYLDRLKAKQQDVIDHAANVGRYTSSGTPGGPGGPPGQNNQGTYRYATDPMLHRLGRSQQIYDQAQISILQRIAAHLQTISSNTAMMARGAASAQPEDIISVGGGRGRGRGSSWGWGGDLGSGLGGGFGRMRIARAIMAPTSTAGVAGMFGLGPIGIGAGLGIGTAMAAAKGLQWWGGLTDITQRAGPGGDISAGTRERMYDEANPIVGGLRRWWREDVIEPLNGITDAIRRSNALAERQSATGAFWHGEAQRGITGLRLESGMRGNMAAVMGGAMPIGAPMFDRSTFAGQIAYQEQQTMFPLRQQSAQAARVSQARDLDVGTVRRELRAAMDQEQRQGDFVGRARNALTDTTNTAFGGIHQRPREIAQRNLLIQAENDLNAIVRNRIALEERLRGVQDQAARARSASRQAEMNEQRGRLQNLQAQEQRLSSAAISFGSAGLVERMQMASAVEQFAQFGPGGVSHETIQMALRSPAAMGVQRRLEQFGENDPSFRRIQATGLMDQTTLARNRQEQNRLINELEQNVLHDQERLAAEMSNVFTGAVDRFIETMNRMFQYIDRRIQEENRRRQTNA